MNKELEKKRDDLSWEYADLEIGRAGDACERDINFKAGWNACQKEMQEREDIAVEALEFIEEESGFIDDNGNHVARQALKKLKGGGA